MEFHYMILAVYSLHTKLLTKKLAGTGLTPGQPKILNYLDKHDGSPQNEIASACFIEPASMTSVLNGMEAKGLIERRRQNGNRRTYFIYLTPKGREMAQIIACSFAEITAEVLENISAEDAAQFMDTFTEVYEKLMSMMEVQEHGGKES